MLTSLVYLLKVIFTKDAGLDALHQPDASDPKNPIFKLIKKMAEMMFVILPGIYFAAELDRIPLYLSFLFPEEIRPYVKAVLSIIVLTVTVAYGIRTLIQLRKCRREKRSFFPENIGAKEKRLRAAAAYVASTVAITTIFSWIAVVWGITGLYVKERWGVNIPLLMINL